MKLIEDLGVITNGKATKRRWGIYECPDCKKHYEVQTSNVKSGKATKCRPCSAKVCNITHGLSTHKLHEVWGNMKARCYNVNNSHYSSYGAKGVTVCDEWKTDFKCFYDWAIMTYKTSLRLDKDILCNEKGIDPKIYSPETCQFIEPLHNSQATSKLSATNSSGYRGVSIKKGRVPITYVAQISVCTKKVHIGYYTSSLEAAIAYDKYINDNKLKHTRNFPSNQQKNNN